MPMDTVNRLKSSLFSMIWDGMGSYGTSWEFTYWWPRRDSNSPKPLAVFSRFPDIAVASYCKSYCTVVGKA